MNHTNIPNRSRSWRQRPSNILGRFPVAKRPFNKSRHHHSAPAKTIFRKSVTPNHPRLRDLVVLEIDKDGNQEYRNMSLRVLYNYVLSAISTRRKDCDEKLLHASLLNSSLSFDLPHLQEEGSHNTLLGPRRHHRKDTATSTTNSIPEEEQEESPPPSSLSPQSTPMDEPRRNTRKGSIVLEDLLKTRKTAAGTPNNSTLESNNASPPNNNNNNNNKVVTYRERLGGYLHPRDMRRLVTPFSASNEPALIVRRHVMLLNVDPLRAIVLRDRLLVLVPDGADSILQTLTQRIKEGHFSLEDASEDLEEEEEEEEREVVAITNANERLSSMTEVPDVSMDLSSLVMTTPPSQPTSGVKKNEEEDHNNDSELLLPLHDGEWDEMQAKKWIHLPFELQSMDAVLHTVCSMLSNEASDLEDEAQVVVSYLLEAKTPREGPNMLRLMKGKINEMEKRVQGVIRAINLVLDEDEDLALMNLSRLMTHPERFVQPVPDTVLQEESDEPELILEAYLQQSLTNTNALDLLKNEIDTMEDLMNMQLDAIRNRLLYVNTMVSMFSLVIGVGSFVGSLFGMNLTNGLEYERDVFGQVVIGTCVGIFGLLVILCWTLYRVGGPLADKE